MEEMIVGRSIEVHNLIQSDVTDAGPIRRLSLHLNRIIHFYTSLNFCFQFQQCQHANQFKFQPMQNPSKRFLNILVMLGRLYTATKEMFT